MSDQHDNPIRQAIADAIAQNDVILFMKGSPQAPACGFSARTVATLQALEYVDGSEIDYVEALTGAGFKVENPNVVAACGCGSSFRVAGQDSCSPV